MIIITEVAKKLENILNGVDDETSSLTRPSDFLFRVATNGFHLDKIDDKATGKNFIPVFIDMLGGTNDPIPNLKKSDVNIAITFYFPVRFKETFFAFTDFLNDCFVATKLNYGVNSGKCLSNINVAEFGEIIGLDLNEYATWVANVYQKKIDVMEKYMSMRVVLSLTYIDSSFLLGNDIEYKLKFKVHEDRFEIDEAIYQHEKSKDVEWNGELYYGWVRISGSGLLVPLYTKSLIWQNSQVIYQWLDDDTGMIEYDEISTSSINQDFPYEDNLVKVQSGTGMSNSPISQQLIDNDNFARNIVNITNYNKSIVACVRNNDCWAILLDKYNQQRLNDLIDLQIVKTYRALETKEYTYNQVILSLNENDEIGRLLTMTFAFGDGE